MIPLASFLLLDLLGCWLWILLHLLLQLFDPSFNPGMAEGVFWRHTLIRFPLKTLINEVDEVSLVLVCLHNLS